jgi:signal transduction histidine kinase
MTFLNEEPREGHSADGGVTPDQPAPHFDSFIPPTFPADLPVDYEVAVHTLAHELRVTREQLKVAESLIQQQGGELGANRLLIEQLASALEREHHSNLTKGEFLARLSHELRTPLHALMAYTEMLEQEYHGPLADLQRADLRRMHQSHEHLLGLVNQILDFSSIDNGKRMLDMTVVSLPELIRIVLGMFYPQGASKGIKCTEQTGPEDAVVEADAEALRQILINLVGNAIKFCHAGATVSVSWEENTSQIRALVSDTGPGIPVDKLDVIFEPFTQLSMGTSPKGTGLGLPISRALAEAMGGTLEVKSTLGQGSTFILGLRRARR